MRATAAVLLGLTAGLQPATAQPPAAPDWVQVYEHALGPITFDRTSVRRDADIVTLLSRTLLAEERSDGTKILEARFRYDCRARTSDLLSVAHLRSDGSVVASVEVAPAERLVEPIPAGSPNAAIADAVCR
ncbi:MAG TPA: surface-adhesin E family protein [Allosphingosinicella sp.]|jgi:hypothetical protein